MSEIHELLMACHGRIRRFTRGLLALCETPNEDERVIPTAQSCRRYFAEALPLHAQDEELSLLPRLLALPSPPSQALEAMSAQHELIEELNPQVCAELERIEAGQPLARPELFQRFTATLLEHIGAEEELIFGSLEQVHPDERAAMVLELRGRRTQP